MNPFEDSTINGWIHAPGPITERQTKRIDGNRTAMAASQGIVLAVIIGIAIFALVILAWRVA